MSDSKIADVTFTPIGVIHTPFTDPQNMPIQPAGGKGIAGTVDIFPEYREGLKDLDGFSHICLLYHFHQQTTFKLSVLPFMDNQPRGVFATRAPRRPNGIGLSVVELVRIEDGILHIQNVDILDGTPLLDIKPYVPEFDGQTEIRTGWLEKSSGRVTAHRSDDRFIE